MPISPQDFAFIGLAADRVTAGGRMGAKASSRPIALVPPALEGKPPSYLSPAELRRSGYEVDWSALVTGLRTANDQALDQGMSASSWRHGISRSPAAPGASG